MGIPLFWCSRVVTPPSVLRRVGWRGDQRRPFSVFFLTLCFSRSASLCFGFLHLCLFLFLSIHPSGQPDSQPSLSCCPEGSGGEVFGAQGRPYPHSQKPLGAPRTEKLPSLQLDSFSPESMLCPSLGGPPWGLALSPWTQPSHAPQRVDLRSCMAIGKPVSLCVTFHPFPQGTF